MDPLLPDTWYSISGLFYRLLQVLFTSLSHELKKRLTLLKENGEGKDGAFPYRGSYKKALISLFPELRLEENKFSPVPGIILLLQ